MLDRYSGVNRAGGLWHGIRAGDRNPDSYRNGNTDRYIYFNRHADADDYTDANSDTEHML